MTYSQSSLRYLGSKKTNRSWQIDVMRGKGLKAGLGVLLVAVMLLTIFTGCSSGGGPEPKEVSLLAGSGDWAQLPMRVADILLEDELGYTVMVREASADTAWSALAEGEFDIWSDVWYPNMKSFTDEFVPDQVKIAGDLSNPTTGIYTGADQGWLIPQWTRDTYSIDSLDDIAALEPGDAPFDALDRDGDGLIDLIGGEIGWSVTTHNDEKIDYYNENYNLDMKQMVGSYLGSFDEMLTALKGKLDAQEDVLFYLWTPHHLFAEYTEALGDEDGQILWLIDPWGFFFEPEGTDYYTGFPGNTIYYAYRTGLENDHPEVATLLERIRMTIDDLNAYCYWESIVKDGEVTDKEKDEYTRQWIEDHRVEVDSWLVGL